MRDFQLSPLIQPHINTNEQSGYAEIGLSFTPVTTEPVMVTYTTIQNTAFDDIDYVMQVSETIEISSGLTGTIYIPITNDNIYEGNENFSVIITGISGAAYESDVINEPIIVTIVDNEVEPTLTISNLTCEYGEPITTGVTVGESDENLIFNAKLSHPSKNPISFKFASSIDFSLAPFANSDDFYVNDARQVTIQPGSICTEVITPITHDQLGEEDEKFWVEFTDNSDMEIIPRILVTIVDDDKVYWSIDDLAINEGDVDTGMFFNVSLNNPRPLDLGTISADWTVTSESGNTATFREDYAPRHNLHTGKVRIFGGRIQHLIGENDPMNRIETVGDTIYEPDETFTVTLSNPTGDTSIGDGIAIATLINDDPKPTLTVSADASVSEADGNLAITATLSNQTTEDITLRYSTTNGTAIGGLDFNTQSNVLHTIPALATSSTINIPIMNDDLFESVETFTVTLSSLTNATFPYLADEIEISVLINESGNRPEISLEGFSPDYNSLYGSRRPDVMSPTSSTIRVSESSRTATITANLSHASTEVISVQFTTSDGTATSTGASPDFIALTNQPFIFAPGETSKEITISINQDSVAEVDETFNLALSQANNVSFAESATSISATITIVDDDLPTLSFVTTNFNISEDIGNFNIEVELSKPAPTNVTFEAALSPDTAYWIYDDYEDLLNSSITIPAGTTGPATLTIPINDDRFSDGHHIFYLVLTNLVGAVFSNNDHTLVQTITIVDNNPQIVYFPGYRQSISEDVGTANLEFLLTGILTEDATVTYTVTGIHRATAGTDFIAPTSDSNTAIIRAGQTKGVIPITIIDDVEEEPNETFRVRLSNPQNAAFSGDASLRDTIVTIVDNDKPALEISAANLSTKEGANVAADFTITASQLPSGALTIHYLPESTFFLPDGISGNPQMTAQALTFIQAPNDGPITTTLSIPIDNDILREENGTLRVTLLDDPSEEPKYVLHATNHIATMTIEDDDAKVPVLAITAPTGTPESAGSIEFLVNGYTDQTKSTRASPERPITIQYLVEEVGSGDFLLDSIAGVTASVNLEFSTSTFSAPLIIDLDDDSNIEATGKVKVTLKDDPETVATYTVSTGADKSAEATILDDDAPELSIRGGNAVTEGTNTKAVFRVISNVMPKTPLAVQYTPLGTSFINGSGVKVTATPPLLFTKNRWTGKYEGRLEFDIVNDNIDEPDGEVSVTLNSEATPTTYYVGPTSTASVTVKDDDPSPIILVANTTPIIDEDASEVTIPVRLSNSTADIVVLSWFITPLIGTASTNDYDLKSQILEIERGTTIGLLKVPITDDDIYEGDETFTIVLSEPDNASFLNSLRHPTFNSHVYITVTIEDDELPPVVKFTSPNTAVLEDHKEAVIEFSINSETENDVVVDYVTTAGTATAGTDFIGTPESPASTATITAGELTGTISIPIIKDDGVDEANETFTVTLSNPQNAVLSNRTADSSTSVTITDTDAPILSIAAGSDVKEGTNTTADFTITADIMPAAGLTIYYLPESTGYLPDGITDNQQMTPQALTFTQATSNDPITTTLSITLNDDDVGELNGTLQVTLQSEPNSDGNYVVNPANNSATINVEDDDAEVPVLIVTGPSEGTIESDNTVEFMVTAYDDQAKSNSIDPKRTIEVQFTPEEVDTGDFLFDLIAGVADTVELTFTENNNLWTDTFPVKLSDDRIAEVSGKVKVTLNDDPAMIETYTVSTGDDKSAEAIIWDNEAPELTITAGPAIAEADNVKATFKVISNVKPKRDLAVQYTPTSTYISDSDTKITANPALSFTKNEITGKYETLIELDIENDNEDEPDGSVTVTLNEDTNDPRTYFVGSAATASVPATDDDPTPTISVANLEPSVRENGTTIAIPVVLSHPTTETVEVTWGTIAGTATAGTIDDNNNPTGDFIEQLDQTLEITNGVSANIVININEDNIPENSEIFEVRLTAVSNAAFVTGETQISIMVTITDNDADPQISIDTTAQVDESEGNAMIPITIQGHRTLERSIALTLTTTTGTATATDFTEQDEEIYTILGSSWVKTRDENVQPITVSSILIPITADDVFERNETFTVAYSELSGATFVGGTASPTTITIVDDDQATISIADNSVTESDSGAVNITFDVTLSKAVDREITVNWNAATDTDDSAEFGSDYANVNNSHIGSLTFDIGETSKQISIPITDDTILEGDETFTVTLTEISNGVQYAKQSATGTIIDNETDPILTATAPTSVAEDAGELEINVTLSAMTHAPVTVEFTTTDGTATGSGDNPDFETQTNQTYTIPPLSLTHTFTLPITDDLYYEGNETFTLTLGNANHATISGISGTITFSDIIINDNETSPQISLENTTPSILEGSGQLFLNVNLNSTLTDAITVMYETVDGTSSNAATSTSPNADFYCYCEN